MASFKSKTSRPLYLGRRARLVIPYELCGSGNSGQGVFAGTKHSSIPVLNTIDFGTRRPPCTGRNPGIPLGTARLAVVRLTSREAITASASMPYSSYNSPNLPTWFASATGPACSALRTPPRLRTYHPRS